MKIMIIWIASTLASIVGTVKIYINMLKQIANEGYKINLDKTLEVEENLQLEDKNNSNKISIITLFIPLVNVVYVIKLNNLCIENNYMINELRVLGLLKEMTLEEQKSYEEDSSFNNLLNIFFDKEIDLSKDVVINEIEIEPICNSNDNQLCNTLRIEQIEALKEFKKSVLEYDKQNLEETPKIKKLNKKSF